jgi:hypothetical protein
VRDVSPLSLALEDYQSAAADRGLTGALYSAELALRRSSAEHAISKIREIAEDHIEQVAELHATLRRLVGIYRSESLDRAVEALTPRDMDRLIEQVIRESEYR